MQNVSHRLRRAESGLIVVDIQERLLPAIAEKERVVQNAVRLAQGAAILHVPIFATEQYRKGLGATVPEVAQAIPAFAPIEKLAFSACGADGFVAALREKKVTQPILCGIEAHVCVLLTALDLLGRGLQVSVVADAVCSRRAANLEIGLAQARQAGAVITATETVVFQLLGGADNDAFRELSKLLR